MSKYKFKNNLFHHDVLQQRTENEIENEPILFQCSYKFAMEYGGPITKEFLSKIPDGNCLVDVRVHMLMRGWTPCIPGYHLDFVPRVLENAQPDLNQTTHQQHYMGIVGNCSNPEFIIQPVELEIDETKQIYPQCNIQLENNPDLKRMTLSPNNIWRFTSQDFHRGLPAFKDGWRYFVRASYNIGKTPVNKIRKQVQVYLPFGFKGW